MSCSLEALTSLPMEFSGPGVSPRDSAVMVRKRVNFSPCAAHVPVGDALAHRGVLDRRPAVQLDRARQLEQVLDVRPVHLAHREALVHQRGERDLPALADRAEALASGMRTSVKNTSLKCEAPEICLIGRISMPGDFMSRKKKVRPLCFGTFGSLRVTMMPKSDSARPRSRSSGR